jgi:hypothetical protein
VKVMSKAGCVKEKGEVEVGAADEGKALLCMEVATAAYQLSGGGGSAGSQRRRTDT